MTMSKKLQEVMKEHSATMRQAGIHRSGSVDRETLERRLAEIPYDTRDLTARVMGDPLPGRSALDRRNAA